MNLEMYVQMQRIKNRTKSQDSLKEQEKKELWYPPHTVHKD